MYYDDPYDPTLENEYDIPREYDPRGDDHSYASSTVDTYRKKTRKLIEDAKSEDKGYHKIIKYVGFKKVEIEAYSDPLIIGKSIRNAITGVRQTGYKMGSLDENLFFKVAYLAGGKSMKGASPTLFYDSPEQYERHMACTVSTEIKEKWAERFHNEQMKRRSKETR
jgi:hypothetical protein